MQQYKPGDRIGGEFTVKQVFGGEKRSGMGVVYLIHNREIPKPIVLKTYQDTLNEDARRKFISEAQAWIRAGAHPNIVQAHWVREIAGQLFVAAEYVAPDVEGRNNLTHFLAIGQLRMEVVLLWAVQFCHGMNYARSRGVLAHRDVKPDNLMIDGTGTLKVTDFGLAKSVELEANPQRQGLWIFSKRKAMESNSETKTGAVMGTIPYMAPEQFIDAKAADHRADIYSFGIVLYQMVTGNRYPYQIRRDTTDITTEYSRAHADQAIIPIESPLAPVINRCLEKKPGKRYSTYDAFLTDLIAVAQKLKIKLPLVVQVAKEDEELYAMAQSHLALGDRDRALRAIDEYVAKYADNACGWTEKGRVHYERGEYPQGLAATKRSLDLNPYNTHAWNNYGIGLNRTQAPPAEVKKAYTTALHFDPFNTAAMMNLIGPLVMQNEYAEAAVLTARALKLRPDKPLVTAKAQALLKEFMDVGDLGAAETLLTGWTEARPADVDAWNNLGLISLALKNFDRAIGFFKQVHQLAPDDTFAVSQLAKLYFEKKKGRECLDCCDELLQRGHEQPLAVSLKARVLNFMGSYVSALHFLQPYIDHNPSNDALWAELAEIHEYRDNHDAAIEALQNAKRLLETNKGKHNADNLSFVNEKLKRLLELN